MATPIAFERRIEHLAEPVDDHRFLHLAKNAIIDFGVVVRRLRGLDQRTARHKHEAPAELFDRRALLLVSADHVVDRDAGPLLKMVGADARGDHHAGIFARGFEAPPDQLERRRPVHAHAALGGVHGFGDAEAERPDVAAKGDGRVPVDGGVEPRLAVGERIGDHVRRRIGDAVERRRRRREVTRRAREIGRQPAAGGGKIEGGQRRNPLLSGGKL
jgi:hypothetical protein